jgi:restriction endonuclease Mrr
MSILEEFRKWKCNTCGRVNSTGVVNCVYCKSKGKWKCDTCGRVYSTRVVNCGYCSNKESKTSIKWRCDVCGRVYASHVTRCSPCTIKLGFEKKRVRLHPSSYETYEEYVEHLNAIAKSPARKSTPEQKIVESHSNTNPQTDTVYRRYLTEIDSIHGEAIAEGLYSYEDLMRVSPFDFEKICLVPFEKQGYKVELTPQSGDYGIDGIARKGRKKVFLQCKQYTNDNKVSVKRVQRFAGAMAMHRVRRGYYITTSTFTQQARKAADKLNIKLVDKDNIIEFLSGSLLDLDD